MRAGVEFKPLRKRTSKYEDKCSIEGCGRPHASLGYCSAHVQRVAMGVALDTPIQKRVSPYKRRDGSGNYLCTKCEQYLHVAEFGKGSGVNGIATWCRRCFVTSKYGISRTEFEAMLKAQGGACWICQEIPEDAFVIDHDHSCCPGDKRICGKCTRGLLCKLCNTALGMFKDDPKRIARAIVYLEKVDRNVTIDRG
ncbi:endonuclease VII domain-containing protein [Streptomyces chlorus]